VKKVNDMTKTMKERVFRVLMAVLMVFSVVPVLSGTAYAHTHGYDYNLVIPADVTVIEEGQFQEEEDHPYLRSVTFEPGSKLERIEKNAFSRCALLKDITIPAGVTTIGERAFFESGLESATFLKGSKLETIGANAFLSCKSLSSITIPASTKTIAHGAFSLAENLRSVEFEKNSRLETIGDNAFVGCSSLESITIPASVTSVGSNIFFSCDNLRCFHYIGTQEEWDRIAKAHWDEGYSWVAHFTRHSITKATPEAFGEEKAYCSDCHEYILKSTAIEKPELFTLSATSYTYDGSEKTPDVTVTDSAGEVLDAANYDVTYSGNVNAGTATSTVTFKGDYYAGSKDLTFTIAPASIAGTSVGGVTNRTYNGKAQTQTPVVKAGDRILVNGTDYRLSYKSNKNAGTATMTTTGIGNYTGTKSTTFTINKAANPLTIKAKTATVKYSKVKKKNQTLGVNKVVTFTRQGQGTMTYLKKSGSKKITISKTTGKVTVKKGLKKGTYKVKVKVKANGNSNYKASAWKTVTFRVKVTAK